MELELPDRKLPNQKNLDCIETSTQSTMLIGSPESDQKPMTFTIDAFSKALEAYFKIKGTKFSKTDKKIAIIDPAINQDNTVNFFLTYVNDDNLTIVIFLTIHPTRTYITMLAREVIIRDKDQLLMDIEKSFKDENDRMHIIPMHMKNGQNPDKNDFNVRLTKKIILNKSLNLNFYPEMV